MKLGLNKQKRLSTRSKSYIESVKEPGITLSFIFENLVPLTDEEQAIMNDISKDGTAYYKPRTRKDFVINSDAWHKWQCLGFESYIDYVGWLHTNNAQEQLEHNYFDKD